jgi:hypothetical protein
MRIAYLDESGTPEATGNTTHFVLVAFVIPGHTSYIHLDRAERKELLRQIAQQVNLWADCCVFADCINKQALARSRGGPSPFEEAFDQIVTRFHRYLARQAPDEYGLLFQDRNDTVAERLTQLMRQFHQRGTRWTSTIPRLIETPLFVDSRLTSMVQVADVCSYALRRYLENRLQVGSDSTHSHAERRHGLFAQAEREDPRDRISRW